MACRNQALELRAADRGLAARQGAVQPVGAISFHDERALRHFLMFTGWQQIE
jgi:hypothetical protein